MMADLEPGTRVRVRIAWPPGHTRTPAFIRGCEGEIFLPLGRFPNPEELAYGRDGLPAKTLYRVRFAQSNVWPDYAGPSCDSLLVDLFEHWLEPVPAMKA